MRFATPWAFLALLLIPLLLFVQLGRKKNQAIKFSAVNLFRGTAISWRQRLSRLPLFLRMLALLLLVTALARPQQGIEKTYDISQGIAIEMVIDRSSSMGQEMLFNNAVTTRLDAVKKVFTEFVKGNNRELNGRPSDLIGLVSFARYPETVCPLTLAHEALNGFMDNITLVDNRSEDGTSIGDGIALAAARLQKAEEVMAKEYTNDASGHYEIKSKIIILLTDGAHNAGDLTPAQAAKLAADWGIKIYTIGIGEDIDPSGIQGFFARMNRMAQGVDKKTLQQVADITGGTFRMAGDADNLRAVYAEIDQLEKSKIESVRHIDYAEHFPVFAVSALMLLITETVLRATLLRKTP